MNYIYMYTNKNNGKKYIGQTNNLARRIREHRSVAFNPKSGNHNDYFHMALRKHTEAKFEVTTLYQGEVAQEFLDELEQNYIAQFKTHVSQWGYNLTWGGQGYKKESIYLSNAEDIKADIKSGLSYQLIREKYKCSSSFISSINHGLKFYDPDENYPLNTYQYLNAEDIYPQMVCLLQDPRYRFQEIADKLQCGYCTVKKFNAGTLQKGKFWHGEYPIRDRYFCNRPRWYQALNLLLTTTTPSRIIGRDICHISDTTMAKLNRGELLFQEDVEYPIRKS